MVHSLFWNTKLMDLSCGENVEVFFFFILDSILSELPKTHPVVKDLK